MTAALSKAGIKARDQTVIPIRFDECRHKFEKKKKKKKIRTKYIPRVKAGGEGLYILRVKVF